MRMMSLTAGFRVGLSLRTTNQNRFGLKVSMFRLEGSLDSEGQFAGQQVSSAHPV